MVCRAARARFTDDLQYAHEKAINYAGPLRVVDVVAQKILYTTPKPVTRADIRFTPDGRHFLVRTNLDGELPDPGLVAITGGLVIADYERATRCYRLSDACLVWRRATDIMADHERWQTAGG